MGRPGDETVERCLSLSRELRQHVIRKIAPRIAAPHADTEPRKLDGPQLLHHGLHPVVRTRRSRREHSDASELQIDLVVDNQQVRKVDTVILDEPRHRETRELHERQRLHDEERGIAEVLRVSPIRIRSPLQVPPGSDFVDNPEAEVVSSLSVFLPRIPEPDDQLHYFFGASSSFSALPFLMTSGSAGVAAAAAGAAASPSAAVVAADSSAFGITTCTSIVSPSVMAFHFGLVGTSFTRID